jgi:UDP-glucose 4-epimerase
VRCIGHLTKCRTFALLGPQAVGESVAQPLLYYQVNVQGTLNLIASMLATGCRNIVFSSSATVYGEPASVPVDETFPVGACTNPYGVAPLSCIDPF